MVLKGNLQKRDFFFTGARSDRTRDKLKESQFTLHIRRKLLTMEEMRQWNK